MDINDIYQNMLGIQIEVRLNSLFNDAVRLAKIEGLTDDDLDKLKHSITEEMCDAMKDDINKALIQNIPAFERLCPFCKGKLDCTSDHK